MTTAAPDVPVPTVRRTLRGFPELAAEVRDRAPAPAWLAGAREDATSFFAEVGLPGSKDEEWRFTSLQGLAAASFAPPRSPAVVDRTTVAPFLIEHDRWPRLVLVDGRVDLTLSHLPDIAGVTWGSLADAIGGGNALVEQHLFQTVPVEANAFTAINAALFVDGAFLRVAPGVVVSDPLQILHVTTTGATNSVVAPRMLLLVEPGASATVVETFAFAGGGHAAGAHPYLLDVCAEVVVGAGARLEHIRVQRDATSAWHVGFTGVTQDRDSHYRAFTLALGGRLSRHDLHARLGAPHVETLLYGLYLGQNEQLVDNHTVIYHDHPDCNSWEVYKGVLTDRAHGVFNGKVIVQPAAQKTDAKQTNRNLLLSDTARVDTKPQLEIFADDVRCTHGATIGKLDEQQRFYLRTRGIAGHEAQVMLISAFVSEVLVEIEQPRIRSALQQLVHGEMHALIR